MPNAKNLAPGQTEKVHVKVYGQDNANNPSQIVDLTTPLAVVNNNPTIATATVDPNDNRAIIVSGVAPGQAIVFVDTNPALQAANRLQLNVTVIAPPPDNRRVDFLSADDPT